ncbi:unnamed protein product [Peronospora effusa]|nr:unnamed protein product [Peronospora effusa]
MPHGLSPNKRRRKKSRPSPPLMPLNSRNSNFPTGSSESSIVSELPVVLDMSIHRIWHQMVEAIDYHEVKKTTKAEE